MLSFRQSSDSDTVSSESTDSLSSLSNDSLISVLTLTEISSVSPEIFFSFDSRPLEYSIKKIKHLLLASSISFDMIIFLFHRFQGMIR